MKRAFSALAACGIAVGGAILMSQPANAEDLDGLACQRVDSSAAIGNTITYTTPEGCILTVSINAGSPGVVNTPGNGRLVWHQATERASNEAECPSGWGGSWAQWARGGKGGPVCVREVDWGIAPFAPQVVTVTINTESDWVILDSWDALQYATGCNPANDLWYDDREYLGCGV